MTKKLEEMNLYELGKLFPIIIAAHNPEWKKLYDSERKAIENVVGKESITMISLKALIFVLKKSKMFRFY